MDEKKKIGNVNVLDIRKATESSIAPYGVIGNVNVVLYSPETAGFLSRLQFGNLNVSVEAPGENVQIFTAKTVLNRDYFQNKAAAEYLVILGKLIVGTDVTAEEIEAKLSGLTVLGKVIYPQNLTGLFQSKSNMSMGKFIAYPLMSQLKVDDIVLDERMLQSLPDHSELAVVGSVTFPGVVSNELLEQKFARLFAYDGVTCHEENAATIQRFLHKDTPEMKVIPAGFEWIDKPILLDGLALAQQKGRKLYCSEKVQIEPDVTPAQLGEGLAALVCEEFVFCPAGLKETLAQKCDLLKTRAVFYEGMLWLVENEEKLYKSFLEAVDGKITLVVTGVLGIDAEIDAKVLLEKVAKIHNLGVIHCRPEQMGIIQARLGLKDGVIEEPPQPETAPVEDETGIGNANYLAL